MLKPALNTTTSTARVQELLDIAVRGLHRMFDETLGYSATAWWATVSSGNEWAFLNDIRSCVTSACPKPRRLGYERDSTRRNWLGTSQKICDG